MIGASSVHEFHEYAHFDSLGVDYGYDNLIHDLKLENRTILLMPFEQIVRSDLAFFLQLFQRRKISHKKLKKTTIETFSHFA